MDASTLDEGERTRVAIVIQPAPAGSLVDTLLLAHGLTPREREIAQLVLTGMATNAIAARLYVSPWTVQDHLKAVFDKIGVRSRRELVARVNTEGGRPRLDAG
jgi:DNA-binding CsgD family transcriptional regulator